MKGMVTMKINHLQRKKFNLLTILFVVILFLYPFRHVNQGLDMMDAGYSLGHFQFRDDMDLMWKLATYLSNWLGMIFTRLPYGNTWIGMNCYTSLMISMVACVIFLWVSKRYPDMTLGLFLAEMLALSMCWAPSTVLYHYLGYFLISLTAILLFEAIRDCNRRKYVISGVILGLCVLVRMPNITYAALILAVWYGTFLYKKEQNRLPVMQQTLYCLLGYLIGFIPGFLWIAMKYGVSAYSNMIISLFSMTDTATDYKPASMITAIVSDYVQYSVWLLIFGIYLVLGVFFFYRSGKIKIKCYYINAAKLIYCLGMLVVLRFCYGRGMFGIDYRDPFCMYKWVTVYLLCVILLCVFLLCSGQQSKEDRLLASILLIIILVTPLGSNNGLYPIMNNLFLIAPVSFALFYRFYQKYKRNFAVKTWIPFLTLCLSVQVMLFGILFVFHDDVVEKRKVEIEGFHSVNGMVTDVEKADALESLGGYLEKHKKKKIVLFGNIPGISYIYDLQPAIFTTWPDLDSNEIQRLEADLGKTDIKNTIVILSREAAENIFCEQESERNQKEQILLNYITEHALHKAFENELFVVYCEEGETK